MRSSGTPLLHSQPNDTDEITRAQHEADLGNKCADGFTYAVAASGGGSIITIAAGLVMCNNGVAIGGGVAAVLTMCCLTPAANRCIDFARELEGKVSLMRDDAARKPPAASGRMGEGNQARMGNNQANIFARPAAGPAPQSAPDPQSKPVQPRPSHSSR